MIGSVFLSGHLEMAVLLQFALGGLPPFLPIVPDDIGHEHLLDLIRGGPAAVAVQDQLDQLQVVHRGHLPERFHVRALRA